MPGRMLDGKGSTAWVVFAISEDGKYSTTLILTWQRSRSLAVRLRFFFSGSSDLGVPGGRPLSRQSQ
jgi:hypothetical protein